MMKAQLLIETPSLKLRGFRPTDVEKLFRMSQEECMRIWLPSQVYRDESHAASVLAFLISQYETSGDPRIVPLVLGVELKTTGDLVGHVGLSPLETSVEIGFAVEQSQQRRGIATEAVRAMCIWAKGLFALREILGITATQNKASQGVLLRAGFLRKQEKMMRFQGTEQPVLFFEYSPAPDRQDRAAD